MRANAMNQYQEENTHYIICAEHLPLTDWAATAFFFRDAGAEASMVGAAVMPPTAAAAAEGDAVLPLWPPRGKFSVPARGATKPFWVRTLTLSH